MKRTVLRQAQAPCAGLCAAACAILPMLLTGCISREQVYADIYRNRAVAYESWKRAKEGRKGAQTVLKGDLGMVSAVLIAMGNNKQLNIFVVIYLDTLRKLDNQ